MMIHNEMFGRQRKADEATERQHTPAVSYGGCQVPNLTKAADCHPN